jgi:hypothetical protein
VLPFTLPIQYEVLNLQYPQNVTSFGIRDLKSSIGVFIEKKTCGGGNMLQENNVKRQGEEGPFISQRE